MVKRSLYIDGRWTEALGPLLISTNPYSEEKLWEGNCAQEENIDKAVEAAQRAFPIWSNLDIKERKKYLQEFAKELEQQKKDLASLISQETGKPLWESLTEVSAMISKVDISFKAYEERCGEASAPMEDGYRYTRFRPYGVGVVLGPFNLPGHLPNGHTIPALLSGNTVVFKPSELTPAVGEQMMKIWEKIGLPKGVINLVQGARETGKLLVEHPGTAGIFFTGNAESGKAIHKFFAGHPEKILALEMGGNNPLLVFEVEDLKAASYLTIQSAFITAGQRCVCARRLIIPQGKEGNDFLDHFLELTENIRVGPYTQNPEPFMGPVISKEVAKRLLNDQKDLEKMGGKILLEMSCTGGSSALLTPGVIEVTNIQGRLDREIFGPLLQVIRVKDFEEALKEANQTVYGLAAALLSDNPKLYKEFFFKAKAGIVNWNRQMTGASSWAPFGGTGQSGNHQPSAYFACDYCAYPVASIETTRVTMPEKITPGIELPA